MPVDSASRFTQGSVISNRYVLVFVFTVTMTLTCGYFLNGNGVRAVWRRANIPYNCKSVKKEFNSTPIGENKFLEPLATAHYDTVKQCKEEAEVQMNVWLKVFISAEMLSFFSGVYLDVVGPKYTHVTGQVVLMGGLIAIYNNYMVLGMLLAGLTSLLIINSVMCLSCLFPTNKSLIMAILLSACDVAQFQFPVAYFLGTYYPTFDYNLLLKLLFGFSAIGTVMGLVFLPLKAYETNALTDSNVDICPLLDDKCINSVTTPRITTPCSATPCNAMPYSATQCCASPCSVTPCAATPCSATPCAAMPCDTTPCSGTPYVIVPYVTTSGAATPCSASPCVIMPYVGTPCAIMPCVVAPRVVIPFVATPRSADSKREQISDVVASEVTGRVSWRSQMCSPRYLIFTVFWAQLSLRMNLYLLSNEAILRQFGDDGKLTNAFGGIADRITVLHTAEFVNAAAIVVNIISMIPILVIQWAVIFVFLLYKSYLFTVVYAYIAETFGYCNIGILAVLTIFIGGLATYFGGAGLLQLATYMDNDWLYPNLIQLVLGLVGQGLLLVLHYTSAVSQTSKDDLTTQTSKDDLTTQTSKDDLITDGSLRSNEDGDNQFANKTQDYY